MCLLDFSKEFEFKPCQNYQEVQIFFCQIAVVSSTLIIGTQDSSHSQKLNQTESTICQVSLTESWLLSFTHSSIYSGWIWVIGFPWMLIPLLDFNSGMCKNSLASIIFVAFCSFFHCSLGVVHRGRQWKSYRAGQQNISFHISTWFQYRNITQKFNKTSCCIVTWSLGPTIQGVQGQTFMF